MSVAISMMSAVMGFVLAFEPQPNGAPVDTNVVYIGGKVQRPGVYSIDLTKASAVELLSVAKVEGERSSLTLQYIRRTSAEQQCIAMIPLTLLEGDNPITIPLSPGDKLMVIPTKD